jgi:23S rRNA (cytidine2498-2'-O)-methyltransferase
LDLVLPFLRHEEELETELRLLGATLTERNNHYFVVDKLTHKPVWAQEWLPNCRTIEFFSKHEAVKILKGFKNLGVFLPSPVNNRLSSSIRAELRELKTKRIHFEAPSRFNFKYFVWTLFKENELLICENPVSQFPLGWNEFTENKETPPNRAYLKLWEVLALGYISLDKNDVAIDLGSSPGGWTWVLSDFVNKVYSVDRAPLHANVLKKENVVYSAGDAFAVSPQNYKDCTWLFSDIICTPEKLLWLVQKWQDESAVKNFVCSIKFKGLCDFDILKEFRKFPDSKIIHLYQNKNEVTWIKQEEK